MNAITSTTELDPIQRQVIDDVLVRKRNIFLTGSGGVGKSFVTKLLIDLFKKHYALHGYVSCGCMLLDDLPLLWGKPLPLTGLPFHV